MICCGDFIYKILICAVKIISRGLIIYVVVEEKISPK